MEHLRLESFQYVDETEEKKPEGKTQEEIDAEAVATLEEDNKKKAEEGSKAADGKDDIDDKELETQKQEQLTAISAKKEEERTEDEKAFIKAFGKEETDTYSELITTLKGESILDVEEGKEYKGVEGFKEVITDNIKLGITSYKEQLPEKVKGLLTFIEDGGRFEDYQEFLEEEDYSTVDIANKTNQRLIVQDYYTSLGYSDEDIEEKISMLEEKDKLEKEAGIAKDKLSVAQKARVNAREIAQKQTAIANKEKRAATEKAFKDAVMSLEDMQGYKVTNKEKQELYEYMTVPTKSGKSQFQEDSADPKVIATLAFFAKKKFNFEKLEKNIKSKSTSELRELLGKLSKGDVTKSKGQQRQAQEEQEDGKLHIPKLAWM